MRNIICWLYGHKSRVADNDEWSDEKGRISAKWTVKYCTRCLKVLKRIVLDKIL